MSTLEVLEQSRDGEKRATMLFSADSQGFMYVWNIEGYCLDGPETEGPECKKISLIIHLRMQYNASMALAATTLSNLLE